MFSCGDAMDSPDDDIVQNAVHERELRALNRDGKTFYSKDGTTPYTGYAKLMYPSGQVQQLKQYKDGIGNGQCRGWNEIGLKIFEGTYKSGQEHGVVTHWYPNGKIKSQKTYENGKLVKN
jgi:antitoxin component YwqK of YwqJK toxin-antitoxin module